MNQIETLKVHIVVHIVHKKSVILIVIQANRILNRTAKLLPVKWANGRNALPR